MIETDDKSMKQLIHWLLKWEPLQYFQLLGLIRKNDGMKQRYNIMNNYDPHGYEFINWAICEMIFEGELNVQSGWIHINPCITCQHHGEIGCSLTTCKQCKEYTEYKGVDNDDG